MKKIIFTVTLTLLVLTLAACSGSKISLTFDTNGGEELDPLVIKSNDTFNLPVPTREGFLFEGWYLTKLGPDPVTEKNRFEEDVTLYARWISENHISYSNQLDDTNPVVHIYVKNVGVMVLQLFPNIAPNTVNNFIHNIQNDYYIDIPFHRVIEDFMIQGGMGEAGTCNIFGEFTSNGFVNPLGHFRGILSMARTNQPNSASTQFFIMHKNTPGLDGNYAAFGGLIAGFSVLDYIATAPKQGETPSPSIIVSHMTVDTKGVTYQAPVCQ
ncbi:MAG: peptidylprolyl isomerase [Candidatus Izemoplasmataceae bacterium]